VIVAVYNHNPTLIQILVHGSMHKLYSLSHGMCIVLYSFLIWLRSLQLCVLRIQWSQTHLVQWRVSWMCSTNRSILAL